MYYSLLNIKLITKIVPKHKLDTINANA